MMTVLAAVAGWPLLRTIYFSFTDANLDNMGSYAGVGFANFASLAQDPEWWHAVKNTVEFAAISVTLETILGLVIALTLNAHLAGRRRLRGPGPLPCGVPPPGLPPRGERRCNAPFRGPDFQLFLWGGLRLPS